MVHTAFVTLPFNGVPTRRPHVLDLHRTVPVTGGGDRASVRAHADQRGLGPPALTAELTNVNLVTYLAHLGLAGVTNMGIVRPNDGFGIRPAPIEEMLQGFEHVGVA